MKRKHLAIFLVVGLVLSMIVSISISISPGSYGNAETYDLKLSEDDLISTIQDLKRDKPELQVPESLGLFDHKSDHWYVIYFYFPQENQVLFTWTRSKGTNSSSLALVAVKMGTQLSEWKDINRDFSSTENRRIINRFENRILKDINERIDSSTVESQNY